MGVSSDDGTTPVALYADPTTHRLLTSASGAAPTDATYVTLSTNATLTAERVLTGTANQITITDNGAGSTVVLSTPQNIAAASSPTFAGLTLTAFSGAVSAAAGVLSAGTLAVANGGTGVTASTGTVAVVLSNSPTLVTPVLGAATATSINGLTITSSTGTLTLTNAKTLSVTNSLTLSGTDSTTMTFPTTSATIARTDAGQTFTGVQTITNITLPDQGQIKLTVPTTDLKATGPTCGDFNCGYTSSAIGDLVYLDSSSTWQKTDANTAALYNGLLGIALEVKASANALLVALPGSFVYSTTGFPTWTIGSPIYMSETAGAMTQTAPTTTDSATRVVGWAVHADKMYFFPSPDYITHV